MHAILRNIVWVTGKENKYGSVTILFEKQNIDSVSAESIEILTSVTSEN